MKVLVEIEDKDIVLFLGIAKGNGFKRANPLVPYSDRDKQDAMKFVFNQFVESIKKKVLVEKTVEALEGNNRGNARVGNQK